MTKKQEAGDRRRGACHCVTRITLSSVFCLLSPDKDHALATLPELLKTLVDHQTGPTCT
jgi:hypothetical protein